MEFSDLMNERRSIRSFDKKEVTKEQMEELIKAAQMAPTWKNSQTGRYYVVRTGTMLEDLRKDTLPEFNQNSSAGAALVVTTYEKNISGFTNGVADNELGNQWGAYDLGLQAAYFCLKASELGLDTLIMGIRDGEKIRAALSIPESQEVVAVIAVGYRQTDPKCPRRKSLEDIAVFV